MTNQKVASITGGSSGIGRATRGSATSILAFVNRILTPWQIEPS